jgi:protocatechuate 3,4-dioxygenase beta subunit
MKGKPAPGVVVALRLSEPGPQDGPSLKSKTDQEGNYRITGVPSGTYHIAPAAPGFAVAGTKDLEERTIVVIAGETVENIDFELLRGGVITGKISDAEGRPIIEEQIFLMNSDSNDPGSDSLRGGFLTDDRGVYRMFGIAPGRYKVAVGQGQFFMSPGRKSFTQTFYPDVSEMSKAGIVEVTEGSEVSNINITVGRPTHTFAVSGKVIDGENGQPIEGARFRLQWNTEGRRVSFGGNAARSNSKGEFKLENLTPGKYSIYLAPQMGINSGSGRAEFEIVDQDVSGLIVKTATGGASLTGVVLLENPEDNVALSKLHQLHVYAFIQNSPGLASSSAISSDGGFSFNNLQPGFLHISVGDPYRGIIKGFYVARIERNGIVEPRGMEVKSGDRITDADNESSVFSRLRLPEEAEARAKLRHEAEAAKTETDLKPCQNVAGVQLPFAP